MKLYCISDLHNKYKLLDPILPKPGEFDTLIICGDVTNKGSIKEVAAFGRWLSGVQGRFKHIVFVAGNHDYLFEQQKEIAVGLLPQGVHYLENSGVTIDGWNFWGSPQTPKFGFWAFMKERGPSINRYWDAIPEQTDVLITHGPPKFKLDDLKLSKNFKTNRHVGCQDLSNAVERVKPIINVFGHIHQSYGTIVDEQTTFVNCALCNTFNQLTKEPIKIELIKSEGQKRHTCKIL